MSAKSENRSIDVSISSITVPDVRGKSLENAAAVLDSFGITYKTEGDEKGIVVDQSDILTEYTQGEVISLKLSDSNKATVTVPNVVGMSVKNARDTLAALGLSIQIDGGGIATYQDIAEGTTVEKGTTVKVGFVYIE